MRYPPEDFDEGDPIDLADCPVCGCGHSAMDHDETGRCRAYDLAPGPCLGFITTNLPVYCDCREFEEEKDE